MTKKVLFIIIILFTVSCKKGSKLFDEISAVSRGIDFENKITEDKRLNILNYLYFYNGAGVSIGDINNDGLPDIYLVGNQVENKLYLNKGDLQFEDITEKAAIQGKSDWNTGSVMADVNGDGYLDIYVCAVVGLKGFEGHNELFINNGDNTFTESASKYGLDIDNYSSTVTFFDYDLDGDLDMYLLNHAVHTEKSYGKAEIRNNRNYETGDKLFRNNNGYFEDVSEKAGIFGGANGYGLGLSVSDFNQDGYPDLYISNDFHEDDYFYLNNGDGTFTEQLKKYFGHISRFSMGSDAADINNDGYTDIISLDMLPEDEKVLKSSPGDESQSNLEGRVNQFGYHYQYSRNMLQVNREGKFFSEIGLLSGIASTDWSWSALFGDYNQDGQMDLFISNGILRRPNDMDYIQYISNDEIKNKLNTTTLIDKEAIEKMPKGNTYNYIFRGNKDLVFKNESGNWITKEPTISSGAAYADLDLDGDVDIITNNINSHITFYENETGDKANYLSIKLHYNSPNNFAIGSKVKLYSNNQMQYREMYVTRGFQSSVEPVLHFGLADTKTIDSIIVIWPNNMRQKMTNIPVNQILEISFKNAKKLDTNKTSKNTDILKFAKVQDNLGLDYRHIENNFIDFDWKKFIPYKITDRGARAVVGDINGDGSDDIYFGSDRYLPSKIFLQEKGTFKEMKFSNFDSISEVVDAAIFDFDSDGKNDIFTLSAGEKYYAINNILKDNLYTQKDKDFERTMLNDYETNGSVVRPFDFDNDGDVDLFVGGYTSFVHFGKIYASYILINNNNKLVVDSNFIFEDIGMTTDAVWSDFDNDGKTDLIIVGEWMSPKFFRNNGKTFEDVSSSISQLNLNGLWQSIISFDIDKDGDMDYLLGNWGINNKLKASEDFPLKMYVGSFVEQGLPESIVAIEKKGTYYPILNFDELSSQLVFLKKKFTSYKEYASKSFFEIFDKNQLDKFKLYEVQNLKSGYLKNDKGHFSFVPFDNKLQVSPIMCFETIESEGGDSPTVFAAGNYFGVSPYHGRFDGFSGALIEDKDNIKMGYEIGINLALKSARSLNTIKVGDKKYLLITFNNDKIEVYEIL